ncbi:MAG: threonine synthase, partial [Leptospiraceae bacterium]|nr:threonine synthase [Leptospiraceae bacterium]
MKINQYFAQFECINPSCKTTYGIDEVIYTCKKCNSLLQVSHDINALREKSPEEWKQIFDKRWGDARFPNTSGIWNKREWVLPEIETENIVSCGEGKTHLFDTPR